MTDLPFLEQLAEEEALFKGFSLVGNGSVRAAGNLKSGFAVNIDEEGEGGSTPTPPEVCADPITTLTDSVIIRADCVSLPSLGTSASFTDVNLNGTRLGHLDCNCSPDCAGLGCQYQTFFDAGVGNFHAIGYSDTFCGGVDSSADFAAFLFVLHYGGIWYLYMSNTVGPGSFVLFYAESASIAAPIPNTCTYTVENGLPLDNPLLDQLVGDCTLHSGAGNYTGIGMDGTVLIS